ncbi:MAG: cob(I)yrinic acid a,c-diamide adenosyltransferase [Gemmatimonadota bacterium]|jgi:cob(I)alamin adenosyltransferase
MKIYTRTGDAGETGLFGGERVSKGHLRVEAYGTVDELNAALGVAIEAVVANEIRVGLRKVQNDLFSLGAFLATPGAEDGSARPSVPPLPESRVQEMESWIDKATGETPELRSFILPGGTGGAATLHLARTVCRRAERTVVRFAEHQDVHPLLLRYLNRLSDLLFAFARLENCRNDIPDSIWEKEVD